METNDSSSELPFGTRVEIGGRTMLRPGFSLVGLTGMVYLPSPNIPAGCSTVLVDWNAHGYTAENGYEMDSLPPLVNVPTPHLTVLDEEGHPVATPKPATPAAPVAVPPLRKVTQAPVSPEDDPKPGEPQSDSGEDDEPPARPKLRLV